MNKLIKNKRVYKAAKKEITNESYFDKFRENQLLNKMIKNG